MESNKNFESAKFVERLAIFGFGMFNELWLGIRHGLLSLWWCGGLAILACLAYLAQWDKKLFEIFYLGKLYPTKALWVHANWAFWVSSGVWSWVIFRVALKQNRNRQLGRLFTEAGLRSPLGRVPTLVFEKKRDDSTTLLRVNVAGQTLNKFKAAREGIQSNLGGYIDDIRENRTRGTIDIIYAKEEMPKDVELGNPKDLPPCRFKIGETRSSIVSADIRKVPHLLIAGLTGGGKSSFLRQFITTHLLNCKFARFVLIDLKEGLESHLFEGIPNVEIYQDVAKAATRLSQLSAKLPKKLNQIKNANCLDFDDYISKKTDQPLPILKRDFIIVDEAAELFLVGDKSRAADVQLARRVLSDIARRGRAAGMHLVIATQRPDSRSLDPQVKANLPGALCFQMANDASSITVLGNGRATELPATPGRGIWKEGAEMIEIQTPFLTKDETAELLMPLRPPCVQSVQKVNQT